MTIGANIQWGYAGLINFGIMGYTALGGLAAVLVSAPPVEEAWRAGGLNILLCAFIIFSMILGRQKNENIGHMTCFGRARRAGHRISPCA